MINKIIKILILRFVNCYICYYLFTFVYYPIIKPIMYTSIEYLHLYFINLLL